LLLVGAPLYIAFFTFLVDRSIPGLFNGFKVREFFDGGLPVRADLAKPDVKNEVFSTQTSQNLDEAASTHSKYLFTYLSSPAVLSGFSCEGKNTPENLHQPGFESPWVLFLGFSVDSGR
jgi:hypothetical protein